MSDQPTQPAAPAPQVTVRKRMERKLDPVTVTPLPPRLRQPIPRKWRDSPYGGTRKLGGG